MKTSMLVLIVQAGFSAMLLWSCFCRLVKTDGETHREVRWAILFEGIAAGIVLGAPILPILMPRDVHWPAWTTPAWVWLVLLMAVTLMQVVTARFWSEGTVPPQFQRKEGMFGRLATGVGTAVLVLMAAWSAPHAQAQGEPQTNLQPFHELKLGESVTCANPEGCIAFAAQAFAQVLQEAKRRGAQACNHQSGRAL